MLSYLKRAKIYLFVYVFLTASAAATLFRSKDWPAPASHTALLWNIVVVVVVVNAECQPVSKF